MDFDWIRLEYVVDPERARCGPTAAEKALHCLFSDGIVSEEYPAHIQLPKYKVRAYINDRLCWDECCDFSQFAEMLKPGTGTFTPFTTVCDCPECEGRVDEIHSINTGEQICWRTNFPRKHPAGCGNSRDCGDCSDWDWFDCYYFEPKEMKNYCFSAGQLCREVRSLAYAVLRVDALGAAMLGWELPLEDQEKIVEENAANWDSDEILLYWDAYCRRHRDIQNLLQMDFSQLRDHFSWEEHRMRQQDAKNRAQLEKELCTPESPVLESEKQEIPLPKPPAPEIGLLYDGTGRVPTGALLRKRLFFSQIRKALQQHRILRIAYEDADSRCTNRRIAPEICVEISGQVHCIAYCYLRKEPRMFRLDRIRQCSLTKIRAASHGIAEKIRKDGILYLPGGQQFPLK